LGSTDRGGIGVNETVRSSNTRDGNSMTASVSVRGNTFGKDIRFPVNP
jgi:hypothetical protein